MTPKFTAVNVTYNTCMLFDTREEAQRWVNERTGQDPWAGLTVVEMPEDKQRELEEINRLFGDADGR